ncbi:MAG: sodium:solute symporter [Alphaproteobacteria bacterium]|nr:sodium:solute symporter [Alphaproteobacteria bacterium]
MSGHAGPLADWVFAGLFVIVTGIGFWAARWHKADLGHLHEWGLGGRRFGTLITWFLLGGDLYTAYTFIAVPALMFGAGAVAFFAVPYTILVYPILFLVYPRLWSVAHEKGYLTAADFVRGRFGAPVLAAAIALTGIVATLPYIALQLVGMQVVLAGLGLNGNWSLYLAFAVLAGYTWTSGLRAPAMIAVVKDLLIYITILAAVIIIPAQLGGYGAIFAAVPKAKLLIGRGSAMNWGGQSAYATLALGSAVALFLYPHAITGVLSSSSQKVIRRNAVILPAYSLALGLIALLGYMALAAGVNHMSEFASGFRQFGANFAVPALFLKSFPDWFVGVAFAAIAIGALVPAAIMSIACGNLFTRNLWKEFVDPTCSGLREGLIAKWTSLAVKVGALAFALALPHTYAIQLQLLGGIWIIQTLPAVLLALYTRLLEPLALLVGWVTGIGAGTAMAFSLHFKSSIYPLHIAGVTVPCYAALSALLLNMAVSLVFSLFIHLVRGGRSPKGTSVNEPG